MFDLNGTLLDHMTRLVRCCEDILGKLGQPLPTRHRIRRAVGDSVELTVANFVPSELHKTACAPWKEYLKEILTEDANLMPGALPRNPTLKSQHKQPAVFINKVGEQSRTLCDRTTDLAAKEPTRAAEPEKAALEWNSELIALGFESPRASQRPAK